MIFGSDPGAQHIMPPYRAAQQPRERPARLFVLTWDNSKSRENPGPRDLEKRRCYGVYWPHEPYQVALSTGHCFATLADLRTAFALAGDYDIAWTDGRGEEA